LAKCLLSTSSNPAGLVPSGEQPLALADRHREICEYYL
jgi:hypothetical protein